MTGLEIVGGFFAFILGKSTGWATNWAKDAAIGSMKNPARVLNKQLLAATKQWERSLPEELRLDAIGLERKELPARREAIAVMIRPEYQLGPGRVRRRDPSISVAVEFVEGGKALQHPERFVAGRPAKPRPSTSDAQLVLVTVGTCQ